MTGDRKETITFRIPGLLKGRVIDEAKVSAISLTTFVKEALEQELIRRARRRAELIGIDLTKEDDHG